MYYIFGEYGLYMYVYGKCCVVYLYMLEWVPFMHACASQWSFGVSFVQVLIIRHWSLDWSQLLHNLLREELGSAQSFVVPARLKLLLLL